MKNSIRFVYLRDDKKQPIACLAVALDAETKKVAYGVSVLNPKDHFDRDVARDLAVGRLIRKTKTINLDHPTQEINGHYITRRIMSDLLQCDHEELPARARKAAKKWISEADNKQKESHSFFTHYQQEFNYDIDRA